MDDLTNLSTTTTVSSYSLREWWAKFGEVTKALVQVFKLRIVLLLLITAAGSAVIATGGWPGGQAFILLMVTGGLSAAGASALNQYLERDRDKNMVRTRRRPLAAGGTLSPTLVLILGGSMILLSVVIAAITNPMLALFNGLGAAIYLGIYTLWLKPRTVTNIVIGGAAGSCAVLSGSAAAGTWNEPSALALAALIFLWTPVHFWSLAMAYQQDYAHAGFPMLPVNISGRQAAAWIGLHTLGTSIIALVLAAHPKLSLIYLLPTLLTSIQLIRLTIQLYRNPNPKLAFSLFKFSNIYLGLLILMVIIDLIWV
jgi:protoheme IX farnesyltransferase